MIFVEGKIEKYIKHSDVVIKYYLPCYTSFYSAMEIPPLPV